MNIRVTLGSWEEQQHAARPVRAEVFIAEQNVPLEMEWDDMDAACLHAVAYDTDGGVLATGRLLPDGHIGRMAVLKPVRGRGIGSAVLEALMACAKKRGDRAVLLNAQIQAEPFYRRHGFQREGNEFLEAGIAHVCMRCEFD